MPTTSIPIFGGAYKGPSVEANPQECLNLVAEVDNEGGLNALLIRPGLTEVADLGDESLQSDTITNGGFATDSDWTKSTIQWSIAGGKLVRTPDVLSGTELVTDGTFTGSSGVWVLNLASYTYNSNQVNFSATDAPGLWDNCRQDLSGPAATDTMRVTVDIAVHQPSSTGPTFPSTAGVRVNMGGNISAEYNTDATTTLSHYLAFGNGRISIQGKSDGDTKFGIDNVSVRQVISGADNVEQVAADLTGSLVEGVRYKLVFTVDSISGGYFLPSVAGTNGSPVNSSGTHTQNIIAGASGGLKFTSSANLVVAIDNVSLKELLTPNTEMRGAHKMGDNLYVVHGNKLKKITTSYTDTTLTSATNKLVTKTGPVTMAHINNDDGDLQLMINDGTSGVGYIYDETTTTFTIITEAIDTFYGGGSVDSQGSRFVSTRPDTDEFYVSSEQDGLTWDVLDVQTAEGKTSNTRRALAVFENLWILKDDSTEEFYDTGLDPLYQRTSLALIELGTLSANTATILDNAVFWLGHDYTVREGRGSVAKIVSTHHISRMIQGFSAATDAIGFGFTFNNHTLYVLTFPTADTTLVYDLANKIWYEWKSYLTGGTEDDGRYRANCHAEFNNEDIVGDYENNKLYKIDQTVYEDDGNRIRQMRVFRVPKVEGDPVFMHELELDLNTGSGIVTGQGSSPQAMLQISSDGGETYGNEVWAAIGAMGNYATEVVWRRLGRSKNPVFKITISDPIQATWIGAYLKVEKGYD